MQKERMGITERLARASARRPKRTLALWGLAVVVSFVLVGTALGGLSTEGYVSGHPESVRADALMARAFPPTPAQLRSRVSDVIVVHSDRYTVAQPQFRALVSRLVKGSLAVNGVTNGASYLSGQRMLVARDGHAALVQLEVPPTPRSSRSSRWSRAPGTRPASTSR